jgi:hypothetical protein
MKYAVEMGSGPMIYTAFMHSEVDMGGYTDSKVITLLDSISRGNLLYTSCCAVTYKCNVTLC